MSEHGGASAAVQLLPGLLAVLEVLLGEHVELAVQPARLVPAETARKRTA